MLKLLHTSDLHIGMKYNGYPEYIKDELVGARFNALKTLVARANEEQCRLLVIAGDLFEKTTVPQNDVERVIKILDAFAGDCILVLPGNHDFDNGLVDLWNIFKNNASEKILLLNENRVYHLQASHDLDLAVYPAPCNKKHGEENNLKWIGKLAGRPQAAWHLGVAHGALEGLSPDLNGKYFYMTMQELEALPIDLWLLGHTHLPFPKQASVSGNRIFNAGTPEPDGMDCPHKGHAWIIEIDEEKNVQAQRIDTGTFQFIDTEFTLDNEDSFREMKKRFLTKGCEKNLLCLKIKGRIDRQLFIKKEEFFQELSEKLAYFKFDDSDLGFKITDDVIDKGFTRGSFPYQLLS
ncbi:MAG: DNA repair exonuclease, partial [Firmicutes bacterium]|nr:DNA repair exonuclease [Bacillota bacterium]